MKKIYKILLLAILLVSCKFPTSQRNKKPYIVITFDDQYVSQYTEALPILNDYGFKVTNFINTARIGTAGRCTWQMIEEMDFEYGWEIGGHSLNHPYLPNISLEKMRHEIEQDWQNLRDRGLSHESFAIPSGSIDPDRLAIVLEFYQNIRNSMDNQLFYPIDRTNLGYFSYDSSFTPQTIISRFIRATENGEYAVILGFHKIADDDEGFGANCPPEEFRDIMQWIFDNDYEVVTIKELIRK